MSVTQPYVAWYYAYLSSSAWRKKRVEALGRGNYECARCRETEHLVVHHLTYDRIGDEAPEDLRVLYEPCHADEHGRPSCYDRVINAKDIREHYELPQVRLEQAQEDAMRVAFEAQGMGTEQLEQWFDAHWDL